jgi:hypothetical protein
MRKKGWNCLGFCVIYHFFFSYFLLLWVCHCCTCAFFSVCAKSTIQSYWSKYRLSTESNKVKIPKPTEKIHIQFHFFFIHIICSDWMNERIFYFLKKPILEIKNIWNAIASGCCSFSPLIFFCSAFHSNELYLIQFAVQRCKRYWNKIYTKLKKW